MKKELYGYFDYAAATPVFDEAAAAMQPFFSNNFYNASAIYLKAKANRNVIDESRQKIAKAIGAKPTEIIFTAGGTEANNLAIHGIMKNFMKGFKPGTMRSIKNPDNKPNEIAII